MPPGRADILEVCELLANAENLQVTVKEVAKGALMTGAGALAGGLLGGPIGLAIGGSLAAFGSAYTSRGRYRSVIDVIRFDMTDRQRQQLADSIEKILRNIQVQDMAVIATIVMQNTSLKNAILNEMYSFFSKELNFAIV